MHHTNCPRCNMVLAQGAHTCPNCHLNLQQLPYQQPYIPQYGNPAAPQETQKERTYRKLLVTIAIVLMAEFVVAQLPVYFGLYSFSRLINWLDMMIWASVPLIISLVLPKSYSGRIVLIVFSAIYILLRLFYAVLVQSQWYGGDSFN